MAGNLSVEEILAACRAVDGDGADSAAAAAPPPEPAVEPAEETAAAAPPEAAAPPAPAGKMSVEEMLAAARAEKAEGSSAPAKTPAKPPAAESAAKSADPAAGKKTGEMSVAEMLAAARGEKSGAKEPAAKAPAAKKAAGKAAKKPAADGAGSPKAAAGEKSSGPKDTASILAAARGATKPGPITKAEAAKHSEPVAAKPKLVVPPLPEKPGYARAQPAADPAAGEDRRGFFATVAGVFVGSSLAVGFSSLAITHVLWALGLARFMFPNILTEPPTQFTVGFPDELAPGQVQTKYKAQFGVWVVRSEYDGIPQIYALQSVCTHLGCTPNWLEGEQKFKCPCHGSGFYKDGINFEGPAPRPLERFAIRLADDGQLEVDKSRKFKEEVGQWSDSASFVPV